MSTRLLGGLIMTHADDDGLVLPPRLAPAHVVILPVTFKAESSEAVMNYCHKLAADLQTTLYDGQPIRVEIDSRDLRGGDKVWQWIKRGVPIRLEIGPRDMEADSVFMARRDRPHKEKGAVKRGEFMSSVVRTLDEIQKGLLEKVLAHREANTRKIDSKAEFEAFFATPKTTGRDIAGGESPGDDENAPTPVHGGFALAHFCGDPEMEARVKQSMGVTVRCIPLDGFNGGDEPGKCVFTGAPSPRRVVWAKSY